jgi:Glutaredoxin-like domain (DUF836)
MWTRAERRPGEYPGGTGARRAVQRRGMLLNPSHRQTGATIEQVIEHASPDERPVVVMYSRRTCGLCDKARAVILAARERTPFGFDEIFIDGDDALAREYGLRVPVVSIDGVEEFEYEVEPYRFASLVRR